MRAYWAERAARGSNPQIVALVTAHATKASRKAAEKRATAAAQTVSQVTAHAKKASRKAAEKRDDEKRAAATANPAQGGE